MQRIYFGAALSILVIAIVGFRWYILAGAMLYSPDSPSIRLHIAGTTTSKWRAIIATPCMVPALSAVPIACSGSIGLNEDHDACLGLIEVLSGQRAFARSIAFHTHPPDAFLSPIQKLVDLNATTPQSGLRSAHEQEPAGLRRRWIEGMVELVFHLELTVARVTSMDLAMRDGANDMRVLLAIFNRSPKVTLRKAMEIALEGITDSMTYLRSSITQARSLTAELREELQQDASVLPAIIYGDRDSAILAAIHLLTDLDDSLESLRDDANEAVDDLVFNAPRTFAALTCPVHDVDALLFIHCRALRGLVDSLDRLRVSISLVHDRQTTVNEDAVSASIGNVVL